MVDDNLDFFMQDVYPNNIAISTFAARDFPTREKVKQDKD